MKAAQLSEFGGPEKLEIREVPTPSPSSGEILIKVELAGVLFADLLLRRGDYLRFRYDLPTVPGHEVVGTIVEIGDEVQGLEVGMRVCAELISGGAYAEYAVATPARTIAIPDGVPFEKALVYSFNMPAAYLVYYNFVTIAPSSTVLIHSGAGGFSSMLIRIAKRAGNRVIGLVSSEHKRQACLDVGADEVIVSSDNDYAEEVLRLTDGQGVDVIINHRGGPTLQADLACMAFRAQWIFSNVTEAFNGADWSLMNMVYNKCPIISVAASANLYGTEEHQQALQFLHDWLRDEDVEGPSRTFSLDEVADAHRWLESGESTGKLAVVP